MDPTPNQQQPQQAPYQQAQAPQPTPQQQAPYQQAQAPQPTPQQQAPYQQAQAPQPTPQQAAYQPPRTPQMPTQPISATVPPNSTGSNRRAYAIIGVVIAALVVFVVALAMTFGSQVTPSRPTGRNGESTTTTRDKGTSTRDKSRDKSRDKDDSGAPKKRNTSPYGTNNGDNSRQHQDASLTLEDFLE